MTLLNIIVLFTEYANYAVRGNTLEIHYPSMHRSKTQIPLADSTGYYAAV